MNWNTYDADRVYVIQIQMLKPSLHCDGIWRLQFPELKVPVILQAL